MKPNPSHLRLLSDHDPDRELSSGERDETTRNAITYEKIRRVAHARARPSWIDWVTLGVAVVGAVLAGIAAFPVLDDVGESKWFDF